MKIATNGTINLYKTGSVKKSNFNYFFYKFPLEVDTIDKKECEYIESCTLGSIQWHKDYEGQAYEYDFTSFYPSILISEKFPFKKPEYMKLKKLPDKLEYGIYNVKIKTKNDFFRKNVNHWYTHIDIETARKYGFKIKLVDSDINSIIYTKDKLYDGDKIFSNFMNYFFKIGRAHV